MRLIDINETIQVLNDTLESMEGISPEVEQEMIREKLEQAMIDRDEKLLAVARWRKQLQAESKEVIGGEIKRLQDRKKAHESRAKSLGSYLLWGLDQIGGKVKSPIGSLAISPSPPSVEIVDADAIPWDYWTVWANVESGGNIELGANVYRVTTYENGVASLAVVNKKAIIECWKNTGKQVPGAVVTQGQHVRFK